MVQRLGRGLDSLITKTIADGDSTQQAEIPLASIRVNPQQPRRNMDPEALAGLASSISTHGLLQPIVVRRLGTGYELVAGERRFRASKIAGLEAISVVVVEAEGARSLELALIENIQRERLSSIDEALAYRQLLQLNGLTHLELAQQVGKSRSAVTNALRLLDLPDDVQGMVEGGGLSAGQARALLGIPDKSQVLPLARQAAKAGWSVREVERRAQAAKPATKARRPGAKAQRMSFYEEKLMNMYDTKVSIQESGPGGEIHLAFYSKADRDRLIHQLLTQGRDSGSSL